MRVLAKKAIAGSRCLAGLACEEDVEARLILERDGAIPWEVRHGPFGEHDFLNLQESHWTLLVQDVEKHLPELCYILDPFRFIPDWRIDDLMISYAPLHGTVGPHVDSYDVFLVQGLGRRRWQINTRADTRDKICENSELRILRDFEAEETWVLESGDLLYLPPHVAHYGVALEPCLTYSVGFRAPSHCELISSFLEFVLANVDEEIRYADPGLELQSQPGQIHHTTLVRVKNLLQQYLHADSAALESWFGRFITEPKPEFCAISRSEPMVQAQLRQYLHDGGRLERNPGSRFAYITHGQGETALFVDAQEFALGPDVAFLAPLLCNHRVFQAALLKRTLEHSFARDLLLHLINEGYLVIYDED